MGKEGNLDGILAEIQTLVSDKLQVVSYKWLSRNFSVSSNDAKRLLQEFASKHGNELEVIYTLSGWLKMNPEVYNVRLVSGSKLSDAKKEYRGNYSIQVYSVQTCIPKDLAVLWSAEFVQAEELFDQPSTTNNCLRDNRFCGVSNSFVKRDVDGKHVHFNLPKSKICSGIAVPSKNSAFSSSVPTHEGQSCMTEQPKGLKPKSDMQPPTAVENVDESNVIDVPSKHDMGKEKATGPFSSKRKAANEKASHGKNVGSLANLWSRASAKPRPQNPSVDTINNVPRGSATSDAQIAVQEALDSICSDDEVQKVGHREIGGSVGRKRRVVFDFSDDEDEENIVSLASPEPQSNQSVFGSKNSSELEKINLDFEDKKMEKVEIKQEKTSIDDSDSSKDEFKRPLKNDIIGNAALLKAHDPGSEKNFDNNKKDKLNNHVPTSPKRKKVLKTRIDERGREVTEVVWEGDAAGKSNAAETSKTVNDATNNVSAKRPSPVDQPVASDVVSNPVSKTGNIKGTKASKDRKQGNILSFFKKV